jgi:hypothetical protein
VPVGTCCASGYQQKRVDLERMDFICARPHASNKSSTLDHEPGFEMPAMSATPRAERLIFDDTKEKRLRVFRPVR